MAAPRSKSDEFLGETLLVNEQTSALYLKPLKQCCTFWDPESLAAPHRQLLARQINKRSRVRGARLSTHEFFSHRVAAITIAIVSGEAEAIVQGAFR